MKYKFVVDTKLPSLNSYINTNRYNMYAGASMKKDQQSFIRGCIRYQLGNLKIEKPVIVHFTWVEDNRRRDLDNIRFAAKFILDALVECGVLKDDSSKYVCGFSDDYKYEKRAKVIVEIEEIGDTNEN